MFFYHIEDHMQKLGIYVETRSFRSDNRAFLTPLFAVIKTLCKI